ARTMRREISTGYEARSHFSRLHARSQRWAVAVSHPRAGKTVACINDLIDGALRCTRKAPRFAYVAPYFAQAKDVAWSYLKQYTDPIPGRQFNESELRVDLPGDRRIRLYGADNYDRLRGIYLDGVILDEYGDMDPRAWPEVIRPRLADRLGWAVFIGTAHGFNHFAELWDRVQGDAAWFSMMLRASETGILARDELEDARRAMSEEQYLAEFECSFQAAVVGAIWGREMRAAEEEGRICAVPYEPEIAVDTWWDLGVRDAMAIWFTQDVGREVHVVDFYQEVGGSLTSCAAELSRRGYVYGKHHAPHDIRVRELGSGKSRIETADALGIRFDIVPDVGLDDGVNAARAFLSRCWFDREKTETGRLALCSYRRVYDAKHKVFQATPLHDWASDPADAFRYLAVGHKFSPPPRTRHLSRGQMQASGGPATAWLGA
ncbi:MAG: hypothetical protein ACREDY_05565, partial [Bradyrhizobium sp.]